MANNQEFLPIEPYSLICSKLSISFSVFINEEGKDNKKLFYPPGNSSRLKEKLANLSNPQIFIKEDESLKYYNFLSKIIGPTIRQETENLGPLCEMIYTLASFNFKNFLRFFSFFNVSNSLLLSNFFILLQHFFIFSNFFQPLQIFPTSPTFHNFSHLFQLYPTFQNLFLLF